MLSSHLVADLERVCDYLIVLAASHVQLAGEVDTLLASHHRLSGPRRDPSTLPASFDVIEESHTDKQSVFLVRTDEPILDPAWTVKPVTMDDLVLAYMSQARDANPVANRVCGCCDDPLHLAPVAHPDRGGRRRARDRRDRRRAHRPAPRAPLQRQRRAVRRERQLRSGQGRVPQKRQDPARVARHPGHRRPGIIGLFWGAPLVARELETGTYRLAWTQSVTRTRWLAVKLAVVGLTSMAVAGLFSLMVSWWASPFDTVNANRFSPPNFDERGIVVIGFAAFAFALGVTAGVVIRRTLPAMATTLVAFVFARLAVIQWIRPHLIAPAVKSAWTPPRAAGGPPPFPPHRNTNADLRPTDHADRHPAPKVAGPHRPGSPVGPPEDRRQAPSGAQHALQECVTKVATKYHLVTTYQPAGRYWAFQWYELAIFVAAALVLSGMCFWFVRRRLA